MTRPSNVNTFRAACLGAVIAACMAAPLAAQDAPPPDAADPQAPAESQRRFELEATDVAGRELVIPAKGQATIVLFVMPDQKRSRDAISHVQELLKDRQDLRAVAVVSGENAAVHAKRLAELAGWTGPMITDPDYKIASKGRVRAWPTTLIVDEQGREAAHIGGLTAAYPRDLGAHADFAAGRIDEARLRERLRSRAPLPEPDQEADRHLALAARLIETGQPDQAITELQRVLELNADDVRARLLLARLLTRQGEPDRALAMIESVAAGQTPPWQLHEARGLAHAAKEQWDRARAELTEAVKLNPQPAESYYWLGRAHEAAGDWAGAARAYRAAFESRAGAD